MFELKLNVDCVFKAMIVTESVSKMIWTQTQTQKNIYLDFIHNIIYIHNRVDCLGDPY